MSLCGAQPGLARRLGKRRTFVRQWLHREGEAPIEYVALVAQAVDDPRVTHFTLRPDWTVAGRRIYSSPHVAHI